MKDLLGLLGSRSDGKKKRSLRLAALGARRGGGRLFRRPAPHWWLDDPACRGPAQKAQGTRKGGLATNKALNELGRYRAFRLRKCKPCILAFCILFAMLQLLGSTYTWFTAEDSVANFMETPPIKPFLVWAVDMFEPEPDEGLYNKRVGAVNLEEKPAFVRLLVTPVFVVEPVNPGDPPTLLPATIGGPGSGAMVIMEDLNTDVGDGDWVDATDISGGGDGYFYYRHILEPGESTDPARNLFNTVTLAPSLPPGYDEAHLVIEVKCEAVGIWPANEYVNSWWYGDVPPSGTPQRAAYELLQQALGL